MRKILFTKQEIGTYDLKTALKAFRSILGHKGSFAITIEPIEPKFDEYEKTILGVMERRRRSS
jgi:hypothetical protein